MTEIPDGYYAVPDPRNPDVLTAWRVAGGKIEPTPARAQYAPALWKRDIPTGMTKAERKAWITNWFTTVERPWKRAIREAILADLDAAGMRYAKALIRCRDCGRMLTDQTSRDAGRGPDCRAQLADAIAAAAKFGGAA